MKKFWLLIGMAAGAGITLCAQHCARIMRGEEERSCGKTHRQDEPGEKGAAS